MKPSIVGLVLTYNGERLLEKCLESLAFCDSILVVDSNSTDKTCEIAEAKRARVVRRAWNGPADQFAFALKLIDDEYSCDWIVSLDQDEICTDTLKDSILSAIEKKQNNNLAGFMVARRSWYYNRFLTHSGWYPDRLLRCFRRGKMQVKVSGAHYSFHPLGNTKNLEGDILHYPYSSFREHLDKINSYAQQGADEMGLKGKHGGIAQGLLHGFGRFLHIYVIKRGFLDGRAGFINACHGAFYAFLKYVRINEGTWGKPYITSHK